MSRLRRAGRVFVLAAGLVGPALPEAGAHEIRPALLEIEERDTGGFDVTWKVPVRGAGRLPLRAVLPDGLERLGEAHSRLVAGALVERSAYRGDADRLAGETIRFDGLSSLQIDVFVRVELADGATHSGVVRPGAPFFRVPERAGAARLAWSYCRLGVVHILEGVDHLLFLLALLLLVRGFRKLLATITAFTLAHSLTLALATLGWVEVPAAPTEAVISLSIVFLAAEVLRLRAGEDPLSARAPWLVAFGFGLFHGLGFAGALSQIGVPAHQVPLALFMFNVGVEIGQLLFVAAVLALLSAASRLEIRPWLGGRLLSYAIGSAAAYWTIERTVSFLGSHSA